MNEHDARTPVHGEASTVDYLIMHDIIMHICHIASILDGNQHGRRGNGLHNA